MRIRNKADVFEITETSDKVAATTIAEASEVEFQLELLKEIKNLREEMDRLVHIQLDLAKLINTFQADVEQKLEAITRHIIEIQRRDV